MCSWPLASLAELTELSLPQGSSRHPGAFVFFTLVGGVPAGAFVYSDLPQYAVALGVALSSALSAALILMLPETAASKAAADKGAEYGTFAEARRDEPGGKAT